MKAWIVSIIAVVIITAIISLILPEGKTGKFIKSIFSLFIVFTIIKPMFYLKNNEFKYEDIFNQSEIELQFGFIEYVFQSKIDEYENNCIEILENSGVNNAFVEIIYSNDKETTIKIECVLINLENSVIISDKSHIDIIKEIKFNVANYLRISDDLVKIYE